MNDFKTFIVTLLMGFLSLLAPIHNFMYAMLILFCLNFIFGLTAARAKNEHWSTKKALWFFGYVAIFLVIAVSAFIIGHLMGEREQAVAVVKILCYIALYIFGTNIFRNMRHICPRGSAWYKLFDLCYYVLSVKFIERFSFIKRWQEEAEKKEAPGNTVLDKDDN